MRVIARPTHIRRENGWHKSIWRRPNWVGSFAGVFLLAFLAPTFHHMSSRRTPVVVASAAPRSWLDNGTLLTVYGHGFASAPYLGRLGTYRDPGDMATQLAGPVSAITTDTEGQPVRLAIHLIYAMATPCSDTPRCLLYLDKQGVNIVRRYIKPAAQRGWLVILDDQLGRSTPRAELRRMIARGYLSYDNVEVAFDPEFHTAAEQPTPGVPTGHVTAGALNAAARLMNAYSKRQGLEHQKLFLVHEWIPGMIRHQNHLTQSLPYVQPALIMDGIGSPHDKLQRYHSLLGNAPMGRTLPGIKLFLPSPYTVPDAVDTPALSWDQLFGTAPIQNEQGTPSFIAPLPRIIVLS
jgi:hypothetical protein